MKSYRKRHKSSHRSFSETLASLMQEKGIGVRELARAAKVPPASISDWKSGQHSPTDYQAVGRVADALGVSMSFLLRGKHDRATRSAPRTLTELFIVGDLLFDGIVKVGDQDDFAAVRVQRLIPRFEVTGEPCEPPLET